jgi:inorganic pyrophosphatase
MRLEAIPTGKNPPEDINVVIEVPVGGEPIKYEMDKASGTLFVDRFLYTPMRYPGNYGFVPHTLSADGDPIDVLVCNTRAIVPGAVINCRPVGVLVMEDDGGGDEKIIAVPATKITKRYEKVKTTADLPDITIQQIQHFFQHYKDLESTHRGGGRAVQGLTEDIARRATTRLAIARIPNVFPARPLMASATRADIAGIRSAMGGGKGWTPSGMVSKIVRPRASNLARTSASLNSRNLRLSCVFSAPRHRYQLR